MIDLPTYWVYWLLTQIAFHLPSRVWMALPNDWRRWWAWQWTERNRFFKP